MYDIVFVGSGPSVLASSVEILKRDSSKKILILEQGSSLDVRKRKRAELKSQTRLNDFDVMTGAGGAGTFSDGKFHFSQALSHYYTKDLLPQKEKKYYDLYLNLAEKYCLDIGGISAEYTPKNPKHIKPVVDLFKENDVDLFIRRARHVGTDKLPGFVEGFINLIEEMGGKFKFDSEVVDLIIENNLCKGVVLKDGEEIYGKKIVMGVGRIGATKLVPKLLEKYPIRTIPRDVLIGGRVAFPKNISEKYADLMYEFVFTVSTKSGHYIRSFCPCLKGGNVAVENYYDDVHGKYSCVNGAGDKTYRSKIGNFAFLRITPPQEIGGDVFKYSRDLAVKTFELGNQKPIVQKISDLVAGKKTINLNGIDKEIIKHLEFNYTLGSVEESYGKEMIQDFREAFLKLNKKNIMKGIVEEGIIVWPEIKFGRNLIIQTDKTEVNGFKNLYAIGDGAGNSGNIVGAMIAGLINAHKILGVNIKDLYFEHEEPVLVIPNYELDLESLETGFEVD